MVQVIQGSADELMEYLRQHRDKHRLVLLVLDAQVAPEASPHTVTSLNEIEYENGLPQIPKRGVSQPVTSELVKSLMEENDYTP